MHTFLGVPILLRGVAFGNLYLSEKHGGGDFSEDDEDVIQLLAAQAAVAIENARLYESSTRWLRQLESINEIGNALASQLELEPLLAIVASRLRELVHARLVLIALPDTDEALRVAAADGEIAAAQVGTRLELRGSKVGRVLERGRTERVDSVLDDPEVDQRTARELGVTTALYVPLIVHGRAIGVVAAHDKLGDDTRFDDDDTRLAESLAARAAIAVDLSERVTRDAMRKVVEAQELERKRLARELHDETGQALTSILLGLKSLEQAVDSEEGREGVVVAPGPRRVDASGCAAARGRAPAVGARRLRPRTCTRTARGHLPPASIGTCPPRDPARGRAAAARDRDDACTGWSRRR